MSIKKKFSHLGLSISFYIVFSNLLSGVISFLVTFVTAFMATYESSQAALSAGQSIDMDTVQNALMNIQSNSTLTTMLSMIVSYFVAVPITMLVLNSPKHQDVPLKGLSFSTPYESAQKKNLSYKELFNFILFMFPLGIFGSIIGSGLAALINLATGSNMDDYLSAMLSDMPLGTVLLLSVILAPVFEELLYRYAVIGYCRRYGEWNAIIVSAFIFGIIHTNLFQFFYTFMLGILLGYVYVYTRKLIYTIIMHVTFNFFGAFVPILITTSLAESTMFTIGYSLLQYLVAVIGLILLIRFLKNERLLKTSEGAPIQERFSKEALLNPGMIVLYIICLILTVFLMAFA
ncbi:CPBP family intramembrane glutamic endopeptidase [Butyrivibrio sp. AE3004]|uniref:CPBP family intramembrane glutamic endopeptidase n=1 Tax=Butyrivibrio sp. AE3004 TaxID=1506994 RepID=UPI000493DB2D|nr:CPBP family intramembrane glutamic endopeptidase [Butyrivibrio sp. AE3004]